MTLEWLLLLNQTPRAVHIPSSGLPLLGWFGRLEARGIHGPSASRTISLRRVEWEVHTTLYLNNLYSILLCSSCSIGPSQRHWSVPTYDTLTFQVVRVAMPTRLQLDRRVSLESAPEEGLPVCRRTNLDKPKSWLITYYILPRYIRVAVGGRTPWPVWKDL